MMIGETVGAAVKLVEDTATGNPLTFITDVSKPLKSLLIPFTPIQSGTGDPSPENIRSILPWDGLTVFGGGKNLLNPTKYVFNTITSRGLTFEVQSDGSVKVTGTTESSDFGPTLSVRFKLHAGTYCGYRDDGNVYVAYRKSTSEEGGVTTGLVSPFTLDGSEWVYCNIYVRNPGTFDTILHPQIARENTQTAYEPYKPITETDIVFPSPVYGGTLDVVSGVLTVEWGAVRADSCEWEQYASNPYGQGFRTLGTTEVPFSSWQSDDAYLLAKSNALKPAPYDGTFDGSPLNSFWWNNYRTGYRCIYTHNATVQDLMNFFTENNVIFCGKLAEPYEIQLTPTQITAIVGDNTIWSDADGSMTAVYLKKG